MLSKNTEIVLEDERIKEIISQLCYRISDMTSMKENPAKTLNLETLKI